MSAYLAKGPANTTGVLRGRPARSRSSSSDEAMEPAELEGFVTPTSDATSGPELGALGAALGAHRAVVGLQVR